MAMEAQNWMGKKKGMQPFQLTQEKMKDLEEVSQMKKERCKRVWKKEEAEEQKVVRRKKE